jgi:hypothetical protein
MKSSKVEKYLSCRTVKGPWKISGTQSIGYDGAVVIPALAESSLLFSTLRSLAKNPKDILSRFLILVVVNHREDASQKDKRDNQETLNKLSEGGSLQKDLQLAWVDATFPGGELPKRTGGVGLARKIGFDLALTRFNYDRAASLLISLDADTLTRPDYLPAITLHFQKTQTPGAVISFCHQLGSNPEEDRAIRCYELFLRAYVLGLGCAGSPYAFHTVGSAMACTTEGYIRMGGMNQRGAGEDFYFLQHLAKTGGISRVKGTVVYPSARASNRVPFGTGRSITDLLAKKEGVVQFYRVECFQILADWLALAGQNLDAGGEALQRKARKISPDLAGFLKGNKFEFIWEKLQQNFRTPRILSKGFHEWFDGLKTMKLIHHLSSGPYPRQESESAVPELLRWAGLESTRGMDRQLELLRKVQIGEDY